jgi:hypothetical protein
LTLTPLSLPRILSILLQSRPLAIFGVIL